MTAVLWMLACVADGQDSGRLASSLAIDPEILQVADTPMRRVRWSTGAPSSGEVRYGQSGLDSVVADDVFGTEHDVWVPGPGVGTEWQLQVGSEGDEQTWLSEVFSIEAVSGPVDLPVPEVTIPADAEMTGFELLPLSWPGGGYVAVLNRVGLPLWWHATSSTSTFRTRLNPTGPVISYIQGLPEEGPQTLISTTLDGIETQIGLPNGIHHDFLALPDGSFVTLRYIHRQVGDQVVKSDALQVIHPDGTTRELWDSWDAFEWPGGGLEDGFGALSWPHTNSLFYDEANGKILLSFYYLGSIGQIDVETGSLDWLLGGESSDWTIVGEPFSFQHGPILFDEGRGLTLLSNGDATQGASAVAMAYELDETAGTATQSWRFDDEGAHTHVLLGGCDPVSDGSYTVNWGTRGVMQRVSPEGEVRWSISSRLGSFFGFSQHMTDFVGASQ